jgi:cell division protein FtsW (lipid II flippase)
MFWATLALKYSVSVLFYAAVCLTIRAYLDRSAYPDRMGRDTAGAIVKVLRAVDTGPVLRRPPGALWARAPGARAAGRAPGQGPVHAAGAGRIMDEEAVIGRDPGCDITIPDPFVSARHARVCVSGGSYFVEDLGSANGTFINGRPLVGRERLLPGDRLQIGKVALTLNPPHRTGARAQRAPDGSGRHLLSVMPGALLIAGGLSLYWQQLIDVNNLYLLAAIAVLFGATALGLQSRSGAYFVFLPVATLSALSLVFLLRIDPAIGLRQSTWAIIGLCVFLLTRWLLRDYRRLFDYKYIFMALGVISLLLTVVLGTTIGGSRSWLTIGSFTMEPSELVKIFIIIFLAGYLDENREVLRLGTRRVGRLLLPGWPYLGPLLAAIGLSLLLLVFQKDIGMTLLYFSLFISMVYAATSRLFHLGSGFLLFFGCAFIMFTIFPHVQDRVLVFLDPWRYADAGGYQIIQSLFALGGAGFLGWGLGSGWPELIPAVHTDFIFPLIGEETGLLGALGVLSLYLLLAWQGFGIAIQVTDSFGRLLAFGFSALLSLQALIIVGGVVGVIPLTGVTLPFLSYGGSSYITNSFMIGFLARLSEA